jgi:3-methylcrotonyl-CoA carboxylase alpha subunit
VEERVMGKVLLRTADGNEPVEVVVERGDGGRPAALVVTVAGRRHEVDLEPAHPSGGLLRLEGRVVPYRVCRRGSTVEVWVPGGRHVLEVVERTARRAAAGAGLGAAAELTAPMPGKILRIHAQPGQAFAAHEPLIVMESMKMEMTLSAPAPGRIAEVLCAEDELVEMGARLARLDPAEEPAETEAPT